MMEEHHVFGGLQRYEQRDRITDQTDDKVSKDKELSTQASPIIQGDNPYRAIESPNSGTLQCAPKGISGRPGDKHHLLVCCHRPCPCHTSLPHGPSTFHRWLYRLEPVIGSRGGGEAAPRRNCSGRPLHV